MERLTALVASAEHKPLQAHSLLAPQVVVVEAAAVSEPAATVEMAARAAGQTVETPALQQTAPRIADLVVVEAARVDQEARSAVRALPAVRAAPVTARSAGLLRPFFKRRSSKETLRTPNDPQQERYPRVAH
jgi:hypothetical protein